MTVRAVVEVPESVLARPPAEAGPAGGRRVALAAVPAALMAIAGVTLCVVAARGVPLTRIGDSGLAGVLGWHFWLGFGLLQGAFVAAISTRRPPSWLLVILTAGLVVSVYGAAVFAIATPRGEAAWRHLGIIDHLVRFRSIDAGIDAYFGWPGFFALFAVVGEATGLPLTGVALWAPVWNNALWLLGLGVLVSQLTTDRRLVWLTVWVFASVNWIDQDYFSPQAFAFLLYLVILALVLRLLRGDVRLPLTGLLRAAWASRPRRGRTTQPPPGWPVAASFPAPAAGPTIPAAGRTLGLIVVVVLSTAMIASHQLTPFALVLGVGALVAVGRTSVPRLPVVLALVLTAWLILPASAYLDGHPVAASAGDLGAVADNNLLARVTGGPERLFVMQLRMMVTASVWVLAAVGFARRWRAGHRDLACAALAIAPFVLLPSQSYGGEMLMRVTLFSLPFAAFFAAAALLPPVERPPGVRRVLSGALAAVLCLGLGAVSLGARYGNARFDMFTAGDLAGVRSLYAAARPGDVLVAAAHPTPWRYRDYDAHRYLTLEDLCKAPNLTAQDCFGLVRDAVGRSPSGRGLILINRANREAIRMRNLLPPEAISGVEKQFGSGPEGRLMMQTPEARLYELRVAWRHR